MPSQPARLKAIRLSIMTFSPSIQPCSAAAWIIEKWRSWADTNGDIESRFTKDQLLTNVMIYWTTASITSSTRIYYESRRTPGDGGRVEVPTACAVFPAEMLNWAPRSYVERIYNVQQWTEMPRGGHFGAMEQPELFTEELAAFLKEWG